MTSEEIKSKVTYHAPNDKQRAIFTEFRSKIEDLYTYIDVTVDNSREKSTSLTKLEECMFWANAGISRNQGDK